MRALSVAGVLVLSGVAAVGARSARAEIVTIGANRDNTLFQDEAGSLSNGAGTAVFAGNTTRGFGVRRGLFNFKVQDFIPADAVITRAELVLYCDRSHSNTVSMGLHAMNASWGEGASFTGLGGGTQAERGDATWTTRFYGIGPEWTRPGGDFASAASALLNVSGSGRSYTWSGAGLVADVQRWVSNSETNFGWLLKAENETSIGTAKRFVSREGDPAGRTPRLVVEYTVVPAPGVMTLAALGGVMAGRRRSRRA